MRKRTQNNKGVSEWDIELLVWGDVKEDIAGPELRNATRRGGSNVLSDRNRW